MKSILIVQCEGIGDNILAIPFLSHLANIFKKSKHYLLVGKGRRELFSGLQGFDVVETCETSQVTMLLKSHHDIIFDLGSGNEHISDWISGFELSYGTYVGFCKSKTISNEIAVPVEPQTPQWQQFLKLITILGFSVEPAIKDYKLKTNRADKEYAKLLIGQQNGTPLITFVPGAASSLRKRWPAEYFAELINRLNEHLACQCLLLGDLSEVEMGDKIVKQLFAPIDNLIGITTLGCVIEIVQGSQLVVANDNGIMHLAGLINVPTIGLFGPSDHRRWKPMGPRTRILRSPSGRMIDIHPDLVLKECLELMIF